ncbi:hypothetical protein [Roseomonas sp. CECT 9278]|uniref:hypothetical protein n=1 Tax=Roseomonas sp. CECT 9278 TaxID=2845823 RepID=UPI001E4F2A55|nr:hypothetical protein [Roseomonas sp. CECT 9278]CAH0245974.1 hypothetical protein ROS9278_03016 [Roseomonas sp. CECT 9278]
MPVIPIALITTGLLGNLLLVLLLIGDATAPGRVPLVVAAVLAIGGGALMLGGLRLLEPRRPGRLDHTS